MKRFLIDTIIRAAFLLCGLLSFVAFLGIVEVSSVSELFTQIQLTVGFGLPAVFLIDYI